jgi:myosin heavy subunit
MQRVRESLRRKSLARQAGTGERGGTTAGEQQRAREDDAELRDLYSFSRPEEAAWVACEGEQAWHECTVLKQSGLFVTIRMEGKASPELADLRRRSVLPRNEGRAAQDMTSLRHLNEPCLLSNMEQRCYAGEPGSMIGNVLVWVNPLLAEAGVAAGIVGSPLAAAHAHPCAVAEFAFSQMAFAGDRRRKRRLPDLHVNQSIVASGESGAGKTEASKLVLAHLVERSLRSQQHAVDTPAASGGAARAPIEERLIRSNVVTEAFGNATTLRNANSSRFGKMMRVHFSQLESRAGAPAAFRVSGASVTAYLLERSRVSHREVGERNFNMFYFLVAGLAVHEPALAHTLRLGTQRRVGFRYLVPLASPTQLHVSLREQEAEMLASDRARMAELSAALRELGFSPAEVREVLTATAAVLHLGNIAFAEQQTPEGAVAAPCEVEEGYDPWAVTAELLGIDAARLERLLLERRLTTREGPVAVRRGVSAACFARDAVARSLYGRVWEQVVLRANRALDAEGLGAARLQELPFVGLLDIFGFESFARNGLEQLLINFANEALQQTFSVKVFESELLLYQREGLVLAQDLRPPATDSEPCVALLAGALLAGRRFVRAPKDAILIDLDLQSRELKPSDLKLLELYHDKFAQHPCFVQPHARARHEQFIVRHYAGDVAYTVLGFLEANNEALPKDANELLASSRLALIGPAYRQAAQVQGSEGSSIARAFREQLGALLQELDATTCAFIRCVKPNVSNRREGAGDRSWFSRRYVSYQLKHLSIPQTALVLRSGMPTRVAHDVLVDEFLPALPPAATRRFKDGKVADPRLFVAALLWAFELDAGSVKLGLTKAFFRAGEIAALDRVLQEAQRWAVDEQGGRRRERVASRFAFYFARCVWRRALCKVRCQLALLRLLAERRQAAAATKLEATARAMLARKELGKLREQSKTRRVAEARAEAERLAEALSREKRRAQRAALFVELQRKHLQRLEEEHRRRKLSTLERRRSVAAAAAPVAAGPLSAGAGALSDELAASESDSLDAGSGDVGSGSDSEHEAGADDGDAARMERTLGEIEQRTVRRTNQEINRRASAGIKVSETERARIESEIEGDLLHEAAQFEALRQQHQMFQLEAKARQRLSAASAASAASATSGLSLASSASSEHRLQASKVARTSRHSAAQPPAPPHLPQDLLPAAAAAAAAKPGPVQDPEWRATIERMRQSEFVQDKLARVERELSKAASAGADARNTLERKKSLTGDDVVVVNRHEVEAPFKSAQKQLSELHALVESGEISADQFADMCIAIAKALGRRRSAISLASEPRAAFPGKPIVCRNCRADNNTAQGSACKSCREALPVDVFDQTDAYEQPDKETWCSVAALQCMGGKFFLRLLDVKTRVTYEFEEHTELAFECAWQKRADCKIQTRWVVRVPAEQLEQLAARLRKETDSKTRARLPAAFPQQRPPAKAAPAGRRYDTLKQLRPVSFLNRPRGVVPRSDAPGGVVGAVLSDKQFSDAVHLWLKQVVDAAAENNTFNSNPSGHNPIFKTSFEAVFKPTRNAKLLLKTRGR